MMKFDVIIMGGGPGGNACALLCAKMGLETALIEKNFPGGEAINEGYFPLKVLLATGGGEEVLRERIRKAYLSWYERLEKAGVYLFEGEGVIEDPNTVRIIKKEKENKIATDKLVIAAGAKPISPIQGVEPDGEKIITYQQGMKSSGWSETDIAIIGADVEGSEFASFYNSFGMDVALFEAQDNIMPLCDEDTANYLREQFLDRGINVKTKVSVTGCNYTHNNKVELTFENKASEAFDKVLLTGNSAPLLPRGLKENGIKLKSDGFVEVDSRMKTSVDNIYALGDIIGGITSANAAIHEGRTTAFNLAGKEAKVDYSTMPYVFFTSPQISAVGLREVDANNKGISYKVGKLDLRYNLRAQSLGCERGFCKVILSSHDDILGVHVIGDHISELIPLPSLAYKKNIKPEDITSLPLPHPTISEIIQETIEEAQKKKHKTS